MWWGAVESDPASRCLEVGRQPGSPCPLEAGHPVAPGIPGGAWRRLEFLVVPGGGRLPVPGGSTEQLPVSSCPVLMALRFASTHFLECRIRYSHSVMVTLRFPCSIHYIHKPGYSLTRQCHEPIDCLAASTCTAYNRLHADSRTRARTVDLMRLLPRQVTTYITFIM